MRLGARVSGREILLLRDGSMSTSQQNLVAHAFESSEFGEILDPQTGAPARSRMAVSVLAPTATMSDALDTALVMLSTEEGAKLLSGFADVAASGSPPRASWVRPYWRVPAPACRFTLTRTMPIHRYAFMQLVLLLCLGASARAEILVRWDRSRSLHPTAWAFQRSWCRQQTRPLFGAR